MHDALNEGRSRDEALDILHGLVDRVEVAGPSEDGGREVELIGEIAAMVEAASSTARTTTNAAAGAGVLGSYKSSVKVVAGLSIDPPSVRGSMRRI